MWQGCRHHSIFSNLKIRTAARPNHVPSSRLTLEEDRAYRALSSPAQHGQNRGQSHVRRGMARTVKPQRSSRRTFCSCLLSGPHQPCQALAIFSASDMLHRQRRNTKSLSQVRATKPFNQGNRGQTPQPRSVPDHHVSNSYFLFSQLGLWVNHRMLQTVSHINYQVRSSNKEKKKGKQPKYAVDKTFWIVEEVWALRMDDLIISDSELFN